MSRILFSIFAVAAMAFCASPATAQTTCPNQEVVIFGSSYGYTAVDFKKSGEECNASASGAILFYSGKVTKLGAKDAPNCDKCKTEQATIVAPKGEAKNWVYRGRQIFLDTTNGVSKLKSLGFARVTGDKSDTYFAVFEIRVAYTLKETTKYYMTPIALQLIGNPGIPGIMDAEQKMVDGKAVLEVADTKSKKTKPYHVAIQAGNHGMVMQPLSVFKDEDPMPDPKVKGKAVTDEKPTPAAAKK